MTNRDRYKSVQMATTVAEAQAQNAVLGFDGEMRFLSNYAPYPTQAYGITFPTVEHAFAAAKIDPADRRRAPTEGRAEMLRIAQAPTPGEAKRMGRATLLRPDWETVKYDLILTLVARKFAGSAEARDRLLATGERPLFELNTWNDRIWGVIDRGGDLIGTNWLGRILMTVREDLAH